MYPTAVGALRASIAGVLTALNAGTLPTFTPAHIVIDDEEVKAVLVFFWPEHRSRIESTTITHRDREFAQGLLIGAARASGHMGFVEELYARYFLRPPKDFKAIGKTVAKIVKKAAEEGWFDDDGMTVPEADVTIYENVRLAYRAAHRAEAKLRYAYGEQL